MVNFDKFLASFITEIKKYQPITCYNLPGCIKKALEEQGLEYKDGEIVKSQRRVSAEAKENGYGENEDDRIRKELISFLQLPHLQFVGERKQEMWITWLEKQGEKKSSNKVEPKFKAGDWVVYEENIYQIHNLSLKKYYECLRTDGTVHTFDFENIDSKSHLWTIQDAKDGDILVSQHNQPFIYNGNYNDYRVGAYCGIEYTGEQFVDTYAEICWTDNESISPATKEQRDLLSQKMNEAGYTFDFEKKELKN